MNSLQTPPQNKEEQEKRGHYPIYWWKQILSLTAYNRYMWHWDEFHSLKSIYWFLTRISRYGIIILINIDTKVLNKILANQFQSYIKFFYTNEWDYTSKVVIAHKNQYSTLGSKNTEQNPHTVSADTKKAS